MTSVQHITTAEQLLQAGDLGRCELVRGEPGDRLEGGEVLPGFSVAVDEIFSR